MLSAAFINALSETGIVCDCSSEAIKNASRDASQLENAPLGVIEPGSVEQVQQVVTACCGHSVRLTVAGGGTGLSGGMLGHQAVRLALGKLNQFSFKEDCVRVQAGVSVPEIIRQSAARGFSFPFQPASACRSEDAYDYLGTFVGPVSIGGSLGANASGLVGCKLGAAMDWVKELTVILPDGSIETVTEGLDRYVGMEGRYGIIVEAVIGLPVIPDGIQTYLVSGVGLQAFSRAARALGDCGVLPLLAECMVLTATPPDFGAIARNALADGDGFLTEFGAVFQPEGWLILLQGAPHDTQVSLDALQALPVPTNIRKLNSDEFSQLKEIRSAASDEIGRGVKNPHPETGQQPPLQRASACLNEAIRTFQREGIRPKGEHNFGLLRVFIESAENRETYRREVLEGTAFDDGSLALYDECAGQIETLLNRLLAPRITPEMVAERMAVNFPGNEDLLIEAEKLPDMLEVLGKLMKKYGACPVPLFYCHINFRRQPGWLLVHNRLLMDVDEFVD